MSFIGTVGVVAQQGNQAVASAPTSVSIATGIGGGTYDNSFDTDDSDALLSALTFADATDATANRIILVLEGGNPGPYTLEYGSSGGATAYIKCYLRATGATSYSMTANSLNNSLSNGCSIGGGGDGWGGAFTSQDGTGSTGIGYFSITHGGGRGNITIPAHNDTFQIDIIGSATNSAGTTNATSISAYFEFKDNS